MAWKGHKMNVVVVFVVVICLLLLLASEAEDGVDPLEAYMSSVKGRLDKSKRVELTQELHTLRNVNTTSL